MQLALGLPLATSPDALREQVNLAVAAERLGYVAVWVPEAYGSDAVSLLATMAARTERLEIGSAILQIPGRTPAMTAMTAAGLDALSGGRFRLGLGVSGPQVSEGWHGVAFADPLGRTQEYVHIVRQALSRHRVQADGRHFSLPLPGGQGKALTLALQPQRATIPIYLAAVGPKSVALTGRIADGWHSIFFDAQTGSEQIDVVRAAASDAGRDAFDVVVSAPVSIDSDVSRASERIRPYAALYIGGMGSRTTNFYHGIASRMGYRDAADEVQRRFLARDYSGAAAEVPQTFIERTCLVGDASQIAAGLRQRAEAGVSTLSLNPIGLPFEGQVDTLARVADIARGEGIIT